MSPGTAGASEVGGGGEGAEMVEDGEGGELTPSGASPVSRGSSSKSTYTTWSPVRSEGSWKFETPKPLQYTGRRKEHASKYSQRVMHLPADPRGASSISRRCFWKCRRRYSNLATTSSETTQQCQRTCASVLAQKT